MKTVLLAVLLLMIASVASAEYVQGYYRKDGTYVQGYYRSEPDGKKWNNYGKDDGSASPYLRDNDKDGVPNYLDHDDNNNGKDDDHEK